MDTEYLKPAVVVRDYEFVSRAALSARETLIVHGVACEEDLTSGDPVDTARGAGRQGVGNGLQDPALAGPLIWVEHQVGVLPARESGRVAALQEIMEHARPEVRGRPGVVLRVGREAETGAACRGCKRKCSTCVRSSSRASVCAPSRLPPPPLWQISPTFCLLKTTAAPCRRARSIPTRPSWAVHIGHLRTADALE